MNTFLSNPKPSSQVRHFGQFLAISDQQESDLRIAVKYVCCDANQVVDTIYWSKGSRVPTTSLRSRSQAFSDLNRSTSWGTSPSGTYHHMHFVATEMRRRIPVCGHAVSHTGGKRHNMRSSSVRLSRETESHPARPLAPERSHGNRQLGHKSRTSKTNLDLVTRAAIIPGTATVRGVLVANTIFRLRDTDFTVANAANSAKARMRGSDIYCCMDRML